LRHCAGAIWHILAIPNHDSIATRFIPMKKTETYGAVLAEIQKLEQRAADLRKSELPGVIQRIKEAIEAYGLTAADLGLGGGGGGIGAAPRAAAPARGARAGGASKGTLQTGVAKYRDPKSGKTWTGRGKPPLWIVGVKDRTPFLIDPSQAAAEAPARGAGRAKAGKAAGKRGGRGGPGRKRAGRTAGAAPADARTEGGDTSAS
jgi:DNA-binding protein H-NS